MKVLNKSYGILKEAKEESPRIRIPYKNRLLYYQDKGQNPDFWWESWWSKKDIDETLKTAERGNSFYSRELLSLLVESLPKEGKILDGGCGIGEIVAALHSQGYNIEGIDIDAKTVEAVKQVRPELPVHCEDVLNLHYSDETIDSYISLGVAEHYEEGPEKLLFEANRVLRKGGKLIISVPYYNPIRKLKGFLGLFNKRATPEMEFYQYAFMPKEFSQILFNMGFQVKKIHAYNARAGLTFEIAIMRYPLYLLQKRFPNVLAFLVLNPIVRFFASHMILFIAEKEIPSLKQS